MVFFLPN